MSIKLITTIHIWFVYNQLKWSTLTVCHHRLTPVVSLIITNLIWCNMLTTLVSCMWIVSNYYSMTDIQSMISAIVPYCTISTCAHWTNTTAFKACWLSWCRITRHVFVFESSRSIWTCDNKLTQVVNHHSSSQYRSTSNLCQCHSATAHMCRLSQHTFSIVFIQLYINSNANSHSLYNSLLISFNYHSSITLTTRLILVSLRHYSHYSYYSHYSHYLI